MSFFIKAPFSPSKARPLPRSLRKETVIERVWSESGPRCVSKPQPRSLSNASDQFTINDGTKMPMSTLSQAGWAMTLTSILTLHGCTVLPSTQIPGADVISMSDSNNNTINLIPVTPRLISEMHSQKAWVVQAASFLDEDKAEAMQQALKAKGFSVFRNDIRKHDQNHHRVFIGPKSDKRIAQAFSKYVDSLFGTESIVSNHPEADGSSYLALQSQMKNYTYRVGAGDMLNITVWDHPELTIPQAGQRSAKDAGIQVHQDGTIFYPYVGKVPVAGRHVTEIRQEITRRLSRYIKEPQVDVSVAAFRSQRVFVSGAVNAPRTVFVTNVPTTLIDAINASGGMTTNADWRSVTLTSTRDDAFIKETLDLSALYQRGILSQNRLLKPNDVLHVPLTDALKVFIMGDVIKAKTQRIDRSGLTLAEALNKVEGINETTADATGIFVLRASDAPSQLVDVYQLSASKGPMLILTTQFRLEPMDIVYVTSAPIERWNKLLTQLTNSLSSFYRIDRALTDN